METINKHRLDANNKRTMSREVNLMDDCASLTNDDLISISSHFRPFDARSGRYCFGC
jgi:hypothetical protein